MYFQLSITKNVHFLLILVFINVINVGITFYKRNYAFWWHLKFSTILNFENHQFLIISSLIFRIIRFRLSCKGLYKYVIWLIHNLRYVVAQSISDECWFKNYILLRSVKYVRTNEVPICAVSKSFLIDAMRIVTRLGNSINRKLNYLLGGRDDMFHKNPRINMY